MSSREVKIWFLVIMVNNCVLPITTQRNPSKSNEFDKFNRNIMSVAFLEIKPLAVQMHAQCSKTSHHWSVAL